jgi:hypothetical protein
MLCALLPNCAAQNLPADSTLRLPAGIYAATGADLAVSNAAATGPLTARGIYVTFILSDLITLVDEPAYDNPTHLPDYPNLATDTVLEKYVETVLDNPTALVQAPQLNWDTLNPNNPGRTATTRQRTHTQGTRWTMFLARSTPDD